MMAAELAAALAPITTGSSSTGTTTEEGGTTESTEDLIAIYETADKELKGTNMSLKEWATNSPQLKPRIKRDGINADSEEVKMLGLLWDSLLK